VLRSAIILISLLLLSSCSWVHNFYIINTSEQEVLVEITLIEKPGGFPIFYNGNHHHEAYDIDKEKRPDRNTIAPKGKILSNSPNSFMVRILPRTCLEIGSLSNEDYSSHKQKFINDGYFNLKTIRYSKDDGSHTFNPDQFDAVLQKIDGDYIFEI
jgi:hypothetical protein